MKIFFAVLPLFILISCTSLNYNAGVMPYAIDNYGEVYILLGEEENFWIDFIGGEKKKDNRQVVEIATREFHEETRCYFNRDSLKQLILATQPIMLNSETYRYIIQIPFIPVEEIRASVRPCEDIEKDNYCWIKATTLFEAIDASSDPKNVPLSSCTGEATHLNKIMHANLLPGKPSRTRFEELISENTQTK